MRDSPAVPAVTPVSRGPADLKRRWSLQPLLRAQVARPAATGARRPLVGHRWRLLTCLRSPSDGSCADVEVASLPSEVPRLPRHAQCDTVDGPRKRESTASSALLPHRGDPRVDGEGWSIRTAQASGRLIDPSDRVGKKNTASRPVDPRIATRVVVRWSAGFADGLDRRGTLGRAAPRPGDDHRGKAEDSGRDPDHHRTEVDQRAVPSRILVDRELEVVVPRR